ncbi:MAG: glycosyltransferase [Alphaproteobacteria bacterium]
MARVVMTDDGIAFDGHTLTERALGGAESAFVSLAEALAGRGHEVFVRNNCPAAAVVNGVDWAPLDTPAPEQPDLYVANRSYRLLDGFPGARRRIFWIHNPAQYLLKFRYLWRLARWRPVIIFSGRSHLATYPAWAPDGGRVILPYGIEERFRIGEPAAAPPPPRAIFTSNPLRSLDWLLELWARDIHPALPAAELHVFSGASTYGAAGDRKAAQMKAVLDRARALADQGVRLREPVQKDVLVRELASARAILYRGDPGETYCLALGEAQAMGVPAVIQDIGAVRERIVDGETGFIAADDDAFARSAVALLGDDALWHRQHQAALARQRNWGWDQAAAEFERLLP